MVSAITMRPMRTSFGCAHARHAKAAARAPKAKQFRGGADLRLRTLTVSAIQTNPRAPGSGAPDGMRKKSKGLNGPYVDQLLSALDKTEAKLKAIETGTSGLEREREQELSQLATLRKEAREAQALLETELELQEGYLIEAQEALQAKQRLVAGLEDVVGETRARLEAIQAVVSGSLRGDNVKTQSEEVVAAAWRARQLSAEDVPVTPEEAVEWMAAFDAAEQRQKADSEAAMNAAEARAWISAWREKQVGGASSDEVVLPNVVEARAWISAWREKQVDGASSDEGVLPNVVEARAWISAWREKQVGGASSDEGVLPNVVEARAWISAWREKQVGGASSDEEVLLNVVEARAWISAWREKQVDGVSSDEGVLPNVVEARAWISAWREKQVWGASSDEGVLPNVVEARAWISAWREKQVGGASCDEGVLPNVAEARAWISAWRWSRVLAEKEAWKAKLSAWVESHRSPQDQEAATAPPTAKQAETDIEGCSLTEFAEGGAAVVDLRCNSRPDTVRALSDLIAAASAQAVAARGAFCIALSGSELQYAAVLMAGIPPDEIARWHIIWAHEANVPASSASSSFGAARAAFLGSPRWSAALPHPLQHLPGHGPEEAALLYEAQLRALPADVLPDAARGPARLPQLDLVLAHCPGGNLDCGLEAAFPASPPGEARWVLPAYAAQQAAETTIGSVSLSLEAIQSAMQVIIHH